MSKASEWSSRYVHPFSSKNLALAVAPLASPFMSVCIYPGSGEQVLVSSEDALEAAYWIIRTFGDPQ